MNSLDTNILYYATNADCPEHPAAQELLNRARTDGKNWILADQVLFEYYRLVRNPRVLQSPLSASEAARLVDFFRRDLGVRHCAYDPRLFSAIMKRAGAAGFPRRRLFDLVLAETLRHHGVVRLYTHNPKDFEELGYFEVIDPIAGNGDL